MMSDEIMIGVNAALNQLSKEEKLSKINLVAISDGFLPTFMSPPIPYVHLRGKDKDRTFGLVKDWNCQSNPLTSY